MNGAIEICIGAEDAPLERLGSTVADVYPEGVSLNGYEK